MDYLSSLSQTMWRRVIPAYVDAFHATNSKQHHIQSERLRSDKIAVLGLVCAATSLVIAILSRGKRLATD